LRSGKAVRAFALTLALAAIAGCSVHERPIQPSRQTIAQIGLPVYPHAKPVLGQEINQQMGIMHVDATSVNFSTSDSLAQVEAFYTARLPKTVQRVSVPLPFGQGVMFQFFAGPYQKQVSIVSIKDTRMISLRSMRLFGAPAPVVSRGAPH
jgi:hypothetical protein